MFSKKLIFAIIIVLLVFGNFFFGIKYLLAQKELNDARKSLEARQINLKVVNFSKLFVEKVLKAKNEVSFEDRLRLENSVRDLGDEKVLSKWESFTASKTEPEAQENVKNLLEALVDKIKY